MFKLIYKVFFFLLGWIEYKVLMGYMYYYNVEIKEFIYKWFVMVVVFLIVLFVNLVLSFW